MTNAHTAPSCCTYTQLSVQFGLLSWSHLLEIFNFLGKILRIDINTESGYKIPDSNPYKNEKDKLDVSINGFSRMLSNISENQLIKGLRYKVVYQSRNKKTKEYIFLSNFEDKNMINIKNLRVSGQKKD